MHSRSLYVHSFHPSIHSFIHSSAHLFIHSTYAVHLFLYRFLYHSLLICYSQSASNEGNIHPSSSVCTLISSPSAVFLPLSSSHCYANAAMPDPHHCCLLYLSLSLSANLLVLVGSQRGHPLFSHLPCLICSVGVTLCRV